MRTTTIICILLGMALCLSAPSAKANDSPIAGTMELIVPKTSKDMVDPEAEAAKKWYPMGEPQGDKGQLWEDGTSINELNRRRTPPSDKAQMGGLDTRAGIETQLKNLSEYERDGEREPITFADGRIHSESSVEKSTWKSTITEPIKIDEPILSSQHNVIGAYADMVDDKDFHMSAGPEIHIPESTTSPLGRSDDHPSNSEIGMGMKLMWGF